MVIFCLMLLIILWSFQIIFLDTFYKQIKIHNIKSNLNIITNNFPSENFEELAKEIAEKNDLNIEVIRSDGEILFSTLNNSTRNKIFLFNEALENNGDLVKFYRKDKNNDIISERTIDDKRIMPLPPQMENISSGKIVEDNNKNKYLLLISGFIAPVDSTVTTIRIQLYFITVLMIIFSMILAGFISKKISSPIESVSKSAKELASGNYNINCNENVFKEMSELSDTMNFAASELSKVEKLRKELIANISHDLRTPLTLIKGYAEAMKDLPGEKTTENLQIIIDESQRLNTLVSDILDLSKYQSGSDQLDAKEFNLTKSLNEIISRVQTLVKNENYEIIFNNENDIFIKGDQAKIQQAFYNLLINAINYTGNDRKVYVNQIINNNYIKIEVADTGDGIDEKDLPYIWDRYYKGSKSHARGKIGTGIGLSIVKSIIELHGGTYGVYPQENPKGSVFWFEIKKS